GFPCGFLARARQVQHLQVLGEEVHLLTIERLEHEVKAGLIDLFVDAPFDQSGNDWHPYHFDAVLVGMHVGDREKEEEFHPDEGNEQGDNNFAEKVTPQELAKGGACSPLLAELFQIDDIVWGLERTITCHAVPPSCCALP